MIGRQADHAESKDPYPALLSNSASGNFRHCSVRVPCYDFLISRFTRDPSTAFFLRIRAGKTPLRMTNYSAAHFTVFKSMPSFAISYSGESSRSRETVSTTRSAT
jgi:hypothetical protein